MFENQFDSIKKTFIKYLDTAGISPKTHKNYRSDLNHFTGWVILKVRSFGSYAETLTDSIPFLDTKLAYEYKNYMLENKIPGKTINRRLSTLRHLAKLLVSEQLADKNFMEGIENVGDHTQRFASFDSVVENYRAYLEAEKVSKSTVKNYTSDIKQFLSWLENNQNLLNQNLN